MKKTILSFFFFIKSQQYMLQGIVVHNFNPRASEAEARGSL